MLGTTARQLRADLEEVKAELAELRGAIRGAGAALTLPPRAGTATPAAPSGGQNASRCGRAFFGPGTRGTVPTL